MDDIDLAGLAEAMAARAHTLVPGRDDVARFDEPPRGRPGHAALVVQPVDRDEVRAVVRYAVAAGVRLVPQGANTGLVGASVAPSDQPCVVLSTERLRAPITIEVGDASATVLAGTRLSELNGAAERHGLHLPIDLGADPCLGGMVATNTGGSRVLRHGPMRHHVLGVEVVAADDDATVYGSLAGVRKDSRGIDPTQLVIGSGGTLGVVTAVTVALTPIPRATETWWLAVDDPAMVVDVLTFLDGRRPGTVSAFEYLSANALAKVLAAPGGPPNPFGDGVPAAAVLAEWTFADDGDHDVDTDLAAAAEHGLISDARLVQPAAGWALRHRVTESLRVAGVVLGHDVSVPRRDLMAMRDRAVAAIAAVAPDAVTCDFGHVGDGGLHLNVVVPRDAGPPSAELAAAIRAAIDTVVAEYHGSYSAEHGLGPVNAARWLAATPPLEQQVVAAVKSVLDPHRLLGHPGHPYNLLS